MPSHMIHFRNKEGKQHKICFMSLTKEFCPFPRIEQTLGKPHIKEKHSTMKRVI